jgi:hypothetical protein
LSFHIISNDETHELEISTSRLEFEKIEENLREFIISSAVSCININSVVNIDYMGQFGETPLL